MARKKLLQNFPNVGELGQYNYPFDFDSDNNYYTHENSVSLPARNDKFQDKDLYSLSTGDLTNEVAVDKNMKFFGNPYIRIDNIKIDNSGVNFKHKNIRVRGFIFSQKAWETQHPDTTPETVKYGVLRDFLNTSDLSYCFYNKSFSRKKKKQALDVTHLDAQKIINRFGISDTAELGDFDGQNSSFNFTDSFKLAENDPTFQQLISEVNYNPIYLVFWMRADARRWFGTDRRRRRIQVYKINNQDLFNDIDGEPVGGKVTTITFPQGEATVTKTGFGKGGKGSAGVRKAAYRVSQLNITINTIGGTTNEGFIEQGLIDDYQSKILPPIRFIPRYMFNNELFLKISPYQQLNNSDNSGISQTNVFEDYFVTTTFKISDKNGNFPGLNTNFGVAPRYNSSAEQTQSPTGDDLQTFYNPEQIVAASSPATVGFIPRPVKPSTAYSSTFYDSFYSGQTDGEQIKFYYFVIDWDDSENKIQTLDQWEETKPSTLTELYDLRTKNLYIPMAVKTLNIGTEFPNDLELQSVLPNTSDTFLKNTYTTPGIKTVKFVMFSHKNQFPETAGRWKLCTARFYLDIPYSQYPDFGEVGGDDYTTIPWPYTTPIIGGVNENSNYKKSVQDVLSGGKIGNTDIIDEVFLVSDIENQELGQGIKNMDLEQIRYFNTGLYDMHTLLNVNPLTELGFRPYNYTSITPNKIEDVAFLNIGHTNSNTSNNWYGELATNENRTGTDLYKPVNYSNKTSGVNIKYTATNITGNTWTFFRYQRKDLHNSLKTFAEGGTEYTFKFEIRFNEFSPNAPLAYVFRTANRDNDYGTPIYNFDGFQMNVVYFHRGEDGIYSNSGLTNKLGDYGEWITIERTRKLISDYQSSQQSGTIVDGYPNMEFLTHNWDDNFSGPEAILDFDIRNPIMVETEVYNLTPDESLLNQSGIFYWDGETNKFPEESSVGQIFITDNVDLNLKQNCKLELNTGELIDKSIYDSSGNSNKGILIGDYKVKKNRKGQPMKKQSFVKLPKKTTTEGAL